MQIERSGDGLSTGTAEEGEEVCPREYVATNNQVLLYLGEAVVVNRVRGGVRQSVIRDGPLVQVYVKLGVSPSASVAVAEQVKVSEVVTLLLGGVLTLESSGDVLSTATAEEAEEVSPAASVATTKQVMLSPGEAVVVNRVTVEVLESVSPVVPLVQV